MARVLLVLGLLALGFLGLALLVTGGRAREVAPRPEQAASAERPPGSPASPRTPLPSPEDTDVAETLEETAQRAPAVPDVERRLVVRVVDPEGAPVAGIPLYLTPEEDLGPLDLDRPHTRVTTGDDGRARFDVTAAALLEEPLPWTLVHDVPSRVRPHLLLTPERLAAAEIVSVQPPSGVLEVVLLRPPSDPGDSTHRVRLSLDLLDDEEDADSEPPSWFRTLGADVARFDHVEPGASWRVVVERHGFDVPVEAVGPGPAHAGTTARIEVRRGVDHAVLVFRAVTAEGTPLRRADLELSPDVGRVRVLADGRTIPVRTDRQGRFSYDLRLGLLYWGGEFAVALAPPRPTIAGRVRIPRKTAAGVLDQGDVVLEGPRPLVHGVVRHEDGSPAAGATVFARPETLGGGNRIRPLVATCGADGSFSLSRPAPWSEFEVWAREGQLVSATIEAQRDDELELVLTRAFAVSGHVLFDGAVPEKARVAFRLGGEQLAITPVAEDGTFHQDSLESGSYQLAVEHNGHELARRELRVESDLLGVEIDLRGELWRHEIELLGDEVDHGRLYWRLAGSEPDAKWRFHGFRGNRIDLATEEEVLEVRLSVAGYRLDALPELREHAELRLRPALRVRLRLVTDGTFPTPPNELRAELRRDGLRVASPEGPAAFTEERRELVLLVESPGVAEVRWKLHAETDRMVVVADVIEGPGPTIEVLDQPGEQLFVVDLDGEALTRIAKRPFF